MIRRPPRSTLSSSSAASDVYKRQLSTLERHDEAIECFNNALKFNPRDGVAYGNKGLSLSALGRHGEAIKCFDKAIEINPQNGAAWRFKGISLLALGRKDEADMCFKKA